MIALDCAHDHFNLNTVDDNFTAESVLKLKRANYEAVEANQWNKREKHEKYIK